MSPPSPTKPKFAMVLAAGLGLRMRPITETTPKPLIEVAGRPLIDWALARVQDAGVENAVVNLHYLSAQIEDHLKDRATPNIVFTHEDPVLETGGGIENALPHLGAAPFFVCNSDGLWLDGPGPGGNTNAMVRLAEAWDNAAMDAILLLHDPDHALGYDGVGDFSIASNGQLTRRAAAPDQKAYVFTGVQLLHPRLFANAPGGTYSLNVLYDRALALGRIYGLVHDGEWFHVGTPEARDAAETWLLDHGFGFQPGMPG